MSPGELLPVVLCVALALGTLRLLQPWLPPPPEAGRFAAIDGLRGYLALGVFAHHGALWLNYRRSGSWDEPIAPLYAHLGHDAVTLFFMITAFLFTTKLLDARRTSVDWTALFAGRVMRLVPLYALAMAALALAVAALSHWRLQEPPATLLAEALHWLPLSVAGRPDINGVVDTELITAGVTWSLAYEVLFYSALPLLALLTGHKVGWRWLTASTLATAACLYYNHRAVWFLAFGLGMLAALAVRRPALRAWGASRTATLVALASAGLAVALWPEGRAPGVVLLVGGLFFAVACGNSMLGLLTLRLSRQLGELAYSLYLLHGLLLFALLHADALTPQVSAATHWMQVTLVTPVLVALSVLTHRWVERPGMQRARWLAARLRPAALRA